VSKTVICPKCGIEQEASAECAACGIVFSKFQKINLTQKKPSLPAAPQIRNRQTARIRRQSFRLIRICFLLLLLYFVGVNAWLTRIRSTDWDRSLWTIVYPINADGSDAAAEYIASLEPGSCKPLEEFMAEEARQYGLPLREPFTFVLAPAVKGLPPEQPQNGSLFQTALWTLRMRYWAWQNNTCTAPVHDVSLYILYYDPRNHSVLGHSVGLQKGLIGIIKAYADEKMEAGNNIIIAHELLHLVGARDKYNPVSDQPLYPDGYADPDRQPLLPQGQAEIMACTIPISATASRMPDTLYDTVIGPKTAREINWVLEKEH